MVLGLWEIVADAEAVPEPEVDEGEPVPELEELDEPLTGVIWNGNEYWKMVLSESRVMRRP